ncbi:hypothetical protein PFISCL1PPCAC_5263, partial [Pristionchus fissidentatus]
CTGTRAGTTQSRTRADFTQHDPTRLADGTQGATTIADQTQAGHTAQDPTQGATTLEGGTQIPSRSKTRNDPTQAHTRGHTTAKDR